jgi:molybdopterin-containing oxidoreductase family membrane subunit
VFAVSILINVGMWFERFVIIVSSLHRDFLPSSWASYTPTSIEIATLAGTFGLFFTAFLLFCRFLPVIAMAEVKGVLSYGRMPARAGHPRPAPSGAPAPEDHPERSPWSWPATPQPASGSVVSSPAGRLEPIGEYEEVDP